MLKKIIKYIVVLIIINIITNFNCIYTLNNKQIVYNASDYVENTNVYEIRNINKKINSIKIIINDKITNIYQGNILIKYTNDEFENYDHFNSITPNYNKQESIIYVISNSKIRNLKIYLNNKDSIKTIIINPHEKYKVNIFQTSVLFLFYIFIKFLFKKEEKLSSSKSIIISRIFIILLAIVLMQMSIMKVNDDYNFYNIKYTDAIINKRLSLDIPISKTLQQIKNPYDTSTRFYEYQWDASYYNNKYYCYFGILPIIIIFVPIKLLFNYYMPIKSVAFIYSIIALVSTYTLYENIIRKYFKNISYQLYITTFLYVLFGTKLFWCANRPCFYELVSIAAYSHIMIGLNLTLFSNHRINNIIGYIFLATAVLCRPTALLASILILPKIISKIKSKTFKIKDYISIIIPYFIVGIITMLLNYLRFGNIFEFGIKYQLTTNNLNNTSFSLLKSIWGAFYYLFDGFNIKIMPFRIIDTLNTNQMISDYYIERIGGGLFPTSIFGIFILLLLPKYFNKIKEKELKIYIILLLSLGLVLTLVSSGIGALIGRYMLDFNYLFYFVFAILLLYITKLYKNKDTGKIFILLELTSIICNLYLAITNIM